jgi:hypothetical protein
VPIRARGVAIARPMPRDRRVYWKQRAPDGHRQGPQRERMCVPTPCSASRRMSVIRRLEVS